jgi:hypothetical protein
VVVHNGGRAGAGRVLVERREGLRIGSVIGGETRGSEE